MRLDIYLDGTKIYQEANSRLDRSPALSPGTHRLTIQAYDDLGNIFKSTVYVTVS